MSVAPIIDKINKQGKHSARKPPKLIILQKCYEIGMKRDKREEGEKGETKGTMEGAKGLSAVLMRMG